jgi:hypothetical protein
MLAKEKNQGTAHDIQSVYNLAADLLDLSTSSEKDTMSFYLAEDFTLLPSDVTFQEVMTVRMQASMFKVLSAKHETIASISCNCPRSMVLSVPWIDVYLRSSATHMVQDSVGAG